MLTRKEPILKDAFGSSSEDEVCSPPSASDIPHARESDTQGFVGFNVREYSQVRRKSAKEQEGDTRAGIKVLLPHASATEDKGRRSQNYVSQGLRFTFIL